ncbi:unnamed protein product [Cyclocybe aegerita]|uniref:RNA helicase n=1 Tax=Cyclocybe aegerita TaxID=1973307 RepID=A0A8S0VRU3_CYCAE|nr:unnamed protein product [Cyclocybe aegerita]
MDVDEELSECLVIDSKLAQPPPLLLTLPVVSSQQMPPKRGIVKSGNAGNSSKSSNQNPATSSSASASTGPPPLFPPGSKYPLSLLQERCQKLGWEKPVIDTRQHGDKEFSFRVTLSRHNKKTSQIDKVMMEPHPAYYRPTAIEARHWGATYALYRFSNGIQLNRALPPGPRDYWNELAVEHKTIEEHQKWMYDADPFSAQKMVEERQAKAQQKREEATLAKANPDVPQAGSSTTSSDYPEVIMATSLRELVEDAIKEGFSLYPEAADAAPLTLSQDAIPGLSQQLGHLGFSRTQIRDATTYLSEDSTLTFNLLNSLTPLEACIEYLVLHLPECDLPRRFLPNNNSSNPFITSAHSGNDDLKRRWVEEKAVKEAGWPENAVKDCATTPKFLKKWDLFMVALGRKLLGRELDSLLEEASELTSYPIEADEYEALGAQLEETGHLVLPLFSAPITVHILFSAEEHYPRVGYIPVYITSTTIPAYVRLHLLSRFLLAMESKPDLDVGEGFCMALMRIMEDTWAQVEDNGPPNMSTVLQHIIPRPQRFAFVDQDGQTPEPKGSLSGNKGSARPPRRPLNDDGQIKREFEAIRENDKYKQILAARMKLPAFKAQEDFLNKLEHSRVVVVVGETGCGKTTQLPQFILNSLILSNRGSKASIIVTQPRRLSAISVAARVSDERLDDGSVGYAIRGESKQGRNTRLLFCTTGVVLRRLSTGDALRDISHVIVDEVHERSMDGDFLLLELKQLLKNHPSLKVVLMSATINHETFVKYFENAPLLTIPGFTHPVMDKYLEDVLPLINYKPPSARATKGDGETRQRQEYESQGLQKEVVDAIQNLIRAGRIDCQLVAALVEHIVTTADTRGGILIFLPGVNEIKQCIEAIRQAIRRHDAVIYPLHANLSNDEQRKVFESTKSWKIIAATNVAETSITIDDVVYVIDAGKVKETQYDPGTNLSRLVETWVTQAAAKQRRGRAGRTRPGICYKLFTRRQEKDMVEFPVPEILRVPLENISLSVKAAKEDEDVKAFLSRAINPPAVAAIGRALLTLEEVGAIDQSGKLTPLGKHMSMLPMDVRLAKMLILAAIFQCLGPVVTVVALLSSKPLFVSPMERRDEANTARARFAHGDSDLLTDAKAFDECMQMRKDSKSSAAIRSFCEENFISASTLRDVVTLRQDFVSSLVEMGFIPLDSTPSTASLNTCSDNLNLVKSVLLGGLWPRVARVHLPKDRIKYDKVSAGAVQRENIAKDFKIFDLREGRAFLHPGSVLFGTSAWKPPFLIYFHKYMTTKVFLRDATKVPMYSLLLFGGPVSVNHVRGGLTVGTKDSLVKLAAIPRIGILVNQLRRLLDAQLQRSIEDGTMLTTRSGNPVIHATMALLTYDGKTE